MKRKVWVVSPLFYLMGIVMLGMSIISYRYNKIIFAIELTVTVVSICMTLVFDILLRRSITSALKSVKKAITAENGVLLEDFAIPVVVVAARGDIVWANKAFEESVGDNEGYAGENILKYIYPKTLRQIMSKPKTSVSHKDRDYTVYATPSENSYILYFIDDTEYKEISKMAFEKKPIVCIASFDNKEEMSRGSGSGEDSSISAQVEAQIRDWGINQMGGFVKKLSDGRYLILSDEQHIEKAKSKRYEILDTVRKIKNSKNMSATVSIGIGRGAENIAESERWARQALDMALGRGGDQVAVMNKEDTFEFFGGLSKGVEKRDKVRTRVIAATISDHVKSSDKIYIMGHKNSDLDCVGAAVGMWSVISKGIEKAARIVIDDTATMSEKLIDAVKENYEKEEVFIDPQNALQEVTEDTLLIIVDTHSYNFVESKELLDNVSRVIVIDHHRMMITHIKNTLIFYHEPYASSASEMVAEIVQYIRASAIDKVDAEAMLSGIMLDTKNFVVKTGVRTFEAAAFLRRCGADTVEVKRMFSDTLETYKQKALLVSSSEIYKGCAIATSNYESEDIRISAAQAADELLSIQGVRASFVLFKTGSVVNISGRSLGDVNVQIILEEFGGGGHFTMAGAQVSDASVLSVKKMLIKILNEKLQIIENTQEE